MRRWVVLAVAVVVTLGSADASARPATPKPAPSAKLPKARHAKMPEGALEAPVDPWREKPRYGAPWKRPSDDPKLRGKPIGGSAFEFFFWLWLLPLGLGAGTLVLERRARVRRPEWEVRSPAGSPDGTNRTQA